MHLLPVPAAYLHWATSGRTPATPGDFNTKSKSPRNTWT
ncbi:hypothetical protein BZL29_4980 [Mycobacterium kansasii]|uniref:Uncharacterized protein n=1 Tax=Mycobacterium kansasii TaxID=1768 RepID=A0A1V3X331_MYCKA|nr:hypothetical protein BZL29_4980 [Mycobacterium kansasii]